MNIASGDIDTFTARGVKHEGTVMRTRIRNR